MPINPFRIAEDYIQLRKKCASPSWLDTFMRWNELVIAPVVALFFVFTNQSDLFATLSSGLTIFNAWSDWIRYTQLQFQVQEMFLITMMNGGPRIVTNDPDYMPYVFADAVFRRSERRQHP